MSASSIACVHPAVETRGQIYAEVRSRVRSVLTCAGAGNSVSHIGKRERLRTLMNLFQIGSRRLRASLFTVPPVV